MQLGCNTLLFGGFDLETAFRSIAWAGYTGVEIAAIAGVAEHLPLDRGSDQVAEIPRMAARYGLALTAVEAATDDADRLRRILQVAAEAGIPIVNTGSGGQSDNVTSFARAIDFLGSMALEAERLGVKLGVKAHARMAVYNTRTLEAAVRAVASPALGVDLDVAHIYRANEAPAEAARVLSEAVVHVHIRDLISRAPNAAEPTDQVPGRGNIDLVPVLEVLKKNGFGGPLNLECAGAIAYELWQVVGIASESRGYLHRCLRELDIFEPSRDELQVGAP